MKRKAIPTSQKKTHIIISHQQQFYPFPKDSSLYKHTHKKKKQRKNRYTKVKKTANQI